MSVENLTYGVMRPGVKGDGLHTPFQTVSRHQDCVLLRLPRAARGHETCSPNISVVISAYEHIDQRSVVNVAGIRRRRRDSG